jgi:membrane-associated protease RseP (regulator of RpoE activity)
MAGTFGTVGFFVALVVVIVVHEGAHFGVAKAFGIKVTEFFVGFGPRIWSTQRGETEYGVKWIPAGGYVKIAGMNPYETVAPEEAARTFGAKPIWQRALVIVAGPGTHFVLAFVLFAIWLGFVGQPVAHDARIDTVAPKLGRVASPAAAAGLQEGDRIVALGGIQDPTDAQLLEYTREHVGRPIPFVIERGGERFDVTLTPVLSTVNGEQVGRIGVILQWDRLVREDAGIVGSLTGAGRFIGTALGDTVQNIARVFGPEGIGRVVRLVFTDAPREPTDPASVVGIGQLANQTASGGNAGDLLFLFAVVNVFIGFLNLLPLPPFDGGHLAVLAIERLRGKAVDMRKVIPISVAVVAFFALFTLSVVYLDIVKPISLGP